MQVLVQQNSQPIDPSLCLLHLPRPRPRPLPPPFTCRSRLRSQLLQFGSVGHPPKIPVDGGSFRQNVQMRVPTPAELAPLTADDFAAVCAIITPTLEADHPARRALEQLPALARVAFSELSPGERKTRSFAAYVAEWGATDAVSIFVHDVGLTAWGLRRHGLMFLPDYKPMVSRIPSSSLPCVLEK